MVPLGMEVGLSTGDFVLDGDADPHHRKGRSPQFSAHVYCVQTAAWITMPLGTEVGLGPDDIVLDGDPAPRPLKGHSLQFSANVRCGQTAGWTKVAVGMEVGLGPGDFVFDGDPATPRKEGTPTPTQFLTRVCCGQTAGWMKAPLGTEAELGPGHIVLDGVPAPRERGTAVPLFLAHVYCGHGRPSQLLLSSRNNSCDVACLKFKLPCDKTTGYLRTVHFLREVTTSIRCMSCAFHKVQR